MFFVILYYTCLLGALVTMYQGGPAFFAAFCVAGPYSRILLVICGWQHRSMIRIAPITISSLSGIALAVVMIVDASILRNWVLVLTLIAVSELVDFLDNRAFERRFIRPMI